MAKTWFITGATRGMGAEFVKAALATGSNVVATGRDPKKIEALFPDASKQLLILPLDVADEHQAAAAVTAGAEHFGSIDVLVNNAGYGELGVFESHEAEGAARQFATNVFGLFNVTRAVLPFMRAQRFGRIFNLSSIAGIRGNAGATLYCASKFAVEGFSEALLAEVSQFNIKVTLIEPGYFRTDFLDTSSMRPADKKIADYVATTAALNERYTALNHQQVGDPAKLASLLVELAAHENPPVRLPVGSDASQILADRIDSLRGEFEQWKHWSGRTDGEF
jgi:NAD(P)-dependent dehydrogenase (short-subunit alcohol dehydrogenase family)